jgi:hypothetical protein
LRLVVSQSEPEAAHFEPDATLRKVLEAFNGTTTVDSKLVS